MHLLEDGMTCVPLLAWLHPELRRHLPALADMAGRLEAGNYAEVEPEGEAELDAWLWLQHQTCFGRGAYSLPFLSADYCDKLVVEAEAMAKTVGFTPNDDEDVAYQIPELVLADLCPSLFAALLILKRRAIDVYTLLLYGSKAEVTKSIQFARYESGKTEHGNWHHDEDSDITAVVSLQPEKFEGGGTDIRADARTFFTVPKLSKGNMLLFNGKHTLHRGRQVTTGVRDLLVFWNEYK